MITYEINVNAQEANLEDVATENGWTGSKIVNDNEGNPLPVLDSEGNLTRDANGQVIYQTEPQTASEFVADIIKQELYRIYDITTASLERKYGTLNYNAKQMSAVFKAVTSVGRV